MRAIIVDDELPNIENLRSLLSKYCSQVKVIGEATSVSRARELTELHSPDLIFLDIQLKGESGFDLLKLIDNRVFEVIFITAYNSYGIQAIKYAALDYILKPVDIDELVAAVDKAQKKFESSKHQSQLEFLVSYLKGDENKPTSIALPQQKEIRYVNVEEIIRCEADDVYTLFFLATGEKILVSKSLKEYALLLVNNGFQRTHQSHLVNMAKVKSWLKEDGGVLLLSNGDKVPISKPNRERVKMALTSLTF